MLPFLLDFPTFVGLIQEVNELQIVHVYILHADSAYCTDFSINGPAQLFHLVTFKHEGIIEICGHQFFEFSWNVILYFGCYNYFVFWM